MSYGYTITVILFMLLIYILMFGFALLSTILPIIIVVGILGWFTGKRDERKRFLK